MDPSGDYETKGFVCGDQRAIGEGMTSRRSVLLFFFLVALIAWECLQFVLVVLLSFSCRHCGN